MIELPVSPFEHMMALDDRASHPMSFYIRAELTGTIDQEQWKAAVSDALRRHPLLTAHLSGDPAGKTTNLVWRANAALPPALFWVVGDGPSPAPFGGMFDLKSETPVRIFVRQYTTPSARAEVTIQLHHAATDAAGAIAFFEDVLCHYAQRRGETVVPRPLVAQALTVRNELTGRYRDLGFGRVLANLDRVFRFFRLKPVALAAGDDVQPLAALPASVRQVCDSETLAGLRRGAKRSGGTLNDLLLRDLFVTLAEWNERRGEHGAVRLSMPINMREMGDQMVPASNLVSMCFLDRRPADCRTPQRLMDGIVYETNSIKRWHLGTALLYVVAFAGRMAGMMNRVVPVPPAGRSAATAVLSNLGRVFTGSPLPSNNAGRLLAGDLTLTSVELLPPVRPGTAVAIGCVTYGDELFLSLNYDPLRLGAADATQLLSQFTGRLSRSVQAADAGAAEWRHKLAEIRPAGATSKIAPEARLWSLPIGKNVRPVSLLPERLPPLIPERTL